MLWVQAKHSIPKEQMSFLRPQQPCAVLVRCLLVWFWMLNLGPHACWRHVLPLKYTSSPSMSSFMALSQWFSFEFSVIYSWMLSWPTVGIVFSTFAQLCGRPRAVCVHESELLCTWVWTSVVCSLGIISPDPPCSPFSNTKTNKP